MKIKKTVLIYYYYWLNICFNCFVVSKLMKSIKVSATCILSQQTLKANLPRLVLLPDHAFHTMSGRNGRNATLHGFQFKAKLLVVKPNQFCFVLLTVQVLPTVLAHIARHCCYMTFGIHLPCCNLTIGKLTFSQLVSSKLSFQVLLFGGS